MKVLISLLLFLCLPLQAEPTPLRVGSTLWSGYEPLYLAQHNGYYKDDVRIINYPSTSEVIRAFRNQALEVAALTLDEIVLLEEQDIPVTIFLICDISDGADAILARPPIANMQQLKGQKVAVESTAVGAYVLTRSLELNQLKVADIQPINRENNEQLESYMDNEVNAVVTYEPVRTQLLNAGAKEIFTSREIPGEVVDVLAVHNEYLQSRNGDLDKLVGGWFKALQYMKEQPQRSYEFIASRQKIPTYQVEMSFEGLELPAKEKMRQLMSGQPSTLEQTIQRLAKTMKNNGLLASHIKTSGLISNQFIR